MIDVKDIINSTFFMCASFFLFLNIVRLYKDKKVHGVSLISLTFFSIWGFWQIYYFWNIAQLWSFVGTVAMNTMNVIWAVMAFYYSFRNND